LYEAFIYISGDIFTVWPKTGLSTGTYITTVTATVDNGRPTPSFNISFTVE